MIGFGDPHEAYYEGKLAYVAGVGIGDNPYMDVSRPRAASSQYEQWRGGWLEMAAEVARHPER